ncbi:MAG: penicillin-binding transpeptidase domain-containing protein, partial [Candidatus Margulisiibacteriota bacterium]
PLQMAVAYGAIATGYRMKPYVVSEIKSKNGQTIYRAEPQKIATLPFSQPTMELLRDALGEVVSRGTGIAARVEGMPAAGKTGTAQNPGLPHAWFVCYAPKDNPEVVISVLVVHGQHGDRVSAYIAREILEFYFDNKNKI